jgi:catechol 2,3-dioxygenase-like lactoylglutathione lyase family enzyme
VLTVRSIAATVAWYRDVLGMREETFGQCRTALRFGSQKLNLHEAGRELEPHADRPGPGTADLCFVVDDLDAVRAHLRQLPDVKVELGPVARTGALGPITSVYLRDPDGNLVELAEYPRETG